MMLAVFIVALAGYLAIGVAAWSLRRMARLSQEEEL